MDSGRGVMDMILMRAAAGQILRESDEFQRFLRDVRGGRRGAEW